MNFTAIDFETANHKRTSACQIGLVVVEDGKLLTEFSSYIKPVPGYFISRFTSEHGIDENTVVNAPIFPELWPRISNYFENTPVLVAHNASFDMGVLHQCLGLHNIRANIPQYCCTLKMSRSHLPELGNHRLNTVCDHFGIELDHHEALSDARAAALIAIKLGLK